ncbi:MAG: hypothetical protein ACK4NA_03600 [Alphaproteobacteria bacterium]
MKRIAAQDILDAIDGTAYLADRSGIIMAVGRPAWEAFAEETAADVSDSDAVVGRSLFDMFRGDPVKDAYRELHESAWLRGKRMISFEYRCDSPAVERHMRMSISAIRCGSETVAVLYQSQTLHQRSRIPMMMFEQEKWIREGMKYEDSQILGMCSYCHDVTWPVGAHAENKTWISPEEYYRRLGPSDVVISHGICPSCYERVVRSNKAA